MQMNARVLSVELDHTVWVEAIANTGSCQSCAKTESAHAHGCGADKIGRMFTGDKPRPFRVIDPVGCRQNDEVVIDIADGAVLRSALAVYVLPLVLLFVGAISGAALAPARLPDLGAMAGATLGLLLAAGWLWRFNRHIRNDARFQPVVLRLQHSDFFVLRTV